MTTSFDYIIKLFDEIKHMNKLPKEYCIVFVYNSPETMSDTSHLSECVYPEELNMILDAFGEIAETVMSIDGEDSFIATAPIMKKQFQQVLVYSLAQNLNGDGRRSLVPLLCEYYGFINIGANFFSCAIARSKDIMYSLLKEKGFPFPRTYYIYSTKNISEAVDFIDEGKWLLKPNNESSSIGLEVYDFSQMSSEQVYYILEEYIKKYPCFCVQEFIDGEEVAVPILRVNDDYYCPGISQVNFPEGKTYIDYDMIMFESYDYFEYNGNLKEALIDISARVAAELKLTAMCRIDYRISGNDFYIEDIGANPTISTYNGVNQLYCDHLQASPSCVYAIITYAALIENGLFIPSFN